MKNVKSKKLGRQQRIEFLKKNVGFIVGGLIFSVLSVLVFELLPSDSPINSVYSIKKKNSSEDAELASILSIEPSNYHAMAIGHKNKNDLGLQLYRDDVSKQSVIWFYNQITHNEEITKAILENANSNNIRLSLAFALAYTESNYNPKASHMNTNKTIDSGLFQLNNKTFPNLTESEMYNPYINAHYGLGHLRFCLNTAGNEVSALAMYNAGTTKVRNNKTPQVTLNYVSNIINYSNGLDLLFNSQVAVFYNDLDSSSELLAHAGK
ncbi:MAG: lytic transglycosylase domain-containing protein [Treponemataceae bacterium]|nr:lytic transglycosylase domain-containing protein [Treponemataceae bacterium]